MDYRRTSQCGCIQKLSYGLGHVYNDLCAAVWFSYTLFYLQIVLQLDSMTAGALVMLGQVVDAAATPGAGWAVDRIGTHQTWHLAGSCAVGIGFSLIFSISPTVDHLWSILWYGGLIAVFQVGWATVQISHLSIIPRISRDKTQSADLTTIRYTASVCCGITVYVIIWVVLQDNQEPDRIGPQDFYKFREIALIITFIGASCSAIFYCGTRSTENTYYEDISPESDVPNGTLKPEYQSGLLRSSAIYLVSFLYMASRLFTILNLIYIPFYLEERQVTLIPDNENIRQVVASVPLVSFLASFVTSFILKWKSNSNEKFVYLMGSSFSIAGCLWIAIGVDPKSRLQIYATATLIGIGSSSTMISSLCITANFAKSNGYRGGSVYGAVTFADKFICGGIVLITQHFACQPPDLCPNFFRHVLAYVCGGAVFIGLVSLTILHYYYPEKERALSLLNNSM